MKKAFIILLAVLAALGLFIGSGDNGERIAEQLGIIQGEAVIRVHSLGSPDAEAMRDVQKACAVFPDFLAETLQVKMEHSVDVWVGADREKYEELMRERMDESADSAKQKAQYTSGQALASKHICVINGDRDSLKNASERYSTTGHELFHQIQHELSDGSRSYDNSLFWLDEGSADYVGARLCETLGGRSFAKWYQDVRFSLFSARQVVDLSQLQHITEEERLQLLNTKVHSYSLSDVLVYYLLQRYGDGQPEQKLVAYYQQLRENKAEAAFYKTFGLDTTAFLQEFAAWWQQERMAPAKIQVIAREGVSEKQRQEFADRLAIARNWIKRHWGSDLRGEYQILLAASEADFVTAMLENAQVSRETAQQMAAGSIWAENGSTVFVNFNKSDDEQQQIFTSSTLLARLLLVQELGPEDSGVEWLLRGSSYLVGVGCLIESGHGRLDDYQRAWRKELRRQPPLPTLDRMMTREAAKEMDRQYDSNDLARLSEYAAAELVRRYGWSSLYTWAQAARNSGDGRKSFADVFGIHVTDFAAQVHMLVY